MNKKAMVGLAVIVAVAVILVARGSVRPKDFASIEPALRKGADFTLVSLQPLTAPYSGNDLMHGFKILGSTKVKDEVTRMKIVDALKAATEEKGLAAASCFNARHAITLNYAGHKYEVLVCFECMQVKDYIDGTEDQHFLIGHGAQQLLNEVLTDAGVPIAN